MSKTIEELKPIVRPEGVHLGVMKIDPDKCTHCGLCIENCPFKCLEMAENEVPRMKKEHSCFSCFNCRVACPVDAVSIVSTYHVEGGFFDTGFPRIKDPIEPRDANGNPSEWNLIEQNVLTRRSVRNFKKDPVPESLLRRILEAGRFAPSAGNNQPWRFSVVTDQDFINRLEEACQAAWAGLNDMYHSDENVAEMVASFGEPFEAGLYDPRVWGGVGCLTRKELMVFLNAPAVIFLACNLKMVGPQLQAGICGQNMNLVAKSLGLGFCWSGFGTIVNFIPEVKAQLGFDENWAVQSALCIGFPKFKQEGMVPRMYRPVVWFRPGASGPEVDE
jgi:nitroreductase/NAD-dependent dihydropyrimidine dehydrogenase PreA subunit